MNQTFPMQTVEYVPYIDELFVLLRFVVPLEIGIRNEFELVTQFPVSYRFHIVQSSSKFTLGFLVPSVS